MGTETILGLLCGIGLSAACGFRVFVPLFIASTAAYTGYFTPAENVHWLGTFPAVLAFGIATVIEIAGYFIPWVDNMLDTIATPAAMVAGTFLTASTLVDTEPWLQWTLSLIAGGGIAGIIQLFTGGIRLTSTATTGGLGNPLFATLEAIGSTIVSLLSLLLPVLTGIVIIIFTIIALRKVFKPKTS